MARVAVRSYQGSVSGGDVSDAERRECYGALQRGCEREGVRRAGGLWRPCTQTRKATGW